MSSSKQSQLIRRPGDVFTKIEVVRFILDQVGYVHTADLSRVSIIEPSCGEGEFLMEIMSRLKQSSHPLSSQQLKMLAATEGTSQEL